MLGAAEALQVPHWLALCFSGCIFLGLGYAYRGHGLLGVAAVCSQVMAIMAVQLSTKLVMQSGFAYPTAIACIHFFCVMLGSNLVEFAPTWGHSKLKQERLLEHARWYVRRILPIALLQTCNVVMNTSSLMYIGAGFNSIIGILCPVLTALFAALLGKSFNRTAWLGIIVAIAGDGVISHEGVQNLTVDGQPMHLALLGMGLGVGALCARAIRSVLMDCQMNEYKADKECPKLSPTKLVALTSPAVFVFGLLLAVSIEGLAPWRRLPWLDVRCSALLAFSALCAVFLSIMGMCLIKMLGAAAAQIAGKLNILLTVAMSSSFLGERLTWPFIVGAAMVLLGASFFERAKEPPRKPLAQSPV